MTFLPYIKAIYINTILLKFVYIKAFTVLSYIDFKSNFVISISNICKNIMAKIVTLVNRL